MGVSVAQGQASYTVGQSQLVVSGLGFTPLAVIFWLHCKTSDTVGAGADFFIAMSRGSSNIIERAYSSEDAVATSAALAGAEGTILLNGITQSDRFNGTVTFASGQFTLNLAATASSAWLINYLAIGGSDITNLKDGVFTLNTSTGNQAVTGVGFKPDIVFFLNNGNNASSVTTTVADFGFGVAVSPTKRFAMTTNCTGGATMSANVDGVGYYNSSACMAMLDVGATIVALADLVSMDSDGFTINLTTATPANFVSYFAIKGGQWDCGTSTKPTGATTQSVTGEAFQPVALMLVNAHKTASNSVSSNGILNFGAAISTSSRSYAGRFHNDALNTVAKSGGSSTRCIAEDVSAATIVAADFTSFNSDGWTITWQNTGVADLVGWITVGANAAAGGSCPKNLSLLGAGCS